MAASRGEQKAINTGVPVLSKRLSPDHSFAQADIDSIANEVEDRRKMLEAGGWPAFNGDYCFYYQAVLADTIRDFNYGQSSIPSTAKYKATSSDAIVKEHKIAAANDSKAKSSKISFHNENILTRARQNVTQYPGKVICIPNPANEEVIGGGAFVGAPNLEEDLFRISNLVIALIEHAREEGDFTYKGRIDDIRPAYNTQLKSDEALVTKEVKIIKEILFKEGKHWYVKEFAKLPLDKQFQIAVVSNAALYLRPGTAFTKEQREETVTRIRAHITAMILAKCDVGIFTAFGCGGFNNDPTEIAKIYVELLFNEGYINFFQHVEFAIVDKRCHDIFQAIFKQFEVEKRVEVIPASPGKIGVFAGSDQKATFEISKTERNVVFLTFNEKATAEKFVKDHRVINIQDSSKLLPQPDGDRIPEKWVVRLPEIANDKPYYAMFQKQFNSKHPAFQLPDIDKITTQAPPFKPRC